MEKLIKDLKFEDYDAYYYRLVQIGKAMFDLHDCKSLSREQIELLAMSSSEDKIKGMEIVANNRDKLDIIADALMKYETLTGEEIDKIVNGEEIRVEESNKNDDGVVVNSLFAETFKGGEKREEN